MPLLYEIERLDTHCQGLHILGRANIELEIASIMPRQSPTEIKALVLARVRNTQTFRQGSQADGAALQDHTCTPERTREKSLQIFIWEVLRICLQKHLNYLHAYPRKSTRENSGDINNGWIKAARDKDTALLPLKPKALV
jgi:hypothetical protein